VPQSILLEPAKGLSKKKKPSRLSEKSEFLVKNFTKEWLTSSKFGVKFIRPAKNAGC
jgi:hypothetical protein